MPCHPDSEMCAQVPVIGIVVKVQEHVVVVVVQQQCVIVIAVKVQEHAVVVVVQKQPSDC